MFVDLLFDCSSMDEMCRRNDSGRVSKVTVQSKVHRGTVLSPRKSNASGSKETAFACSSQVHVDVIYGSPSEH